MLLLTQSSRLTKLIKIIIINIRKMLQKFCREGEMMVWRWKVFSADPTPEPVPDLPAPTESN
jgi:hypothetical protein